MKFADRLAHLPSIRKTGAQQTGAQQTPGEQTQVDEPPLQPSEPVASALDPMAELRSKLSRLTGIAAAQAAEKGVDGDASSGRLKGGELKLLPFTRVETEYGPLYQRFVFCSPTEMVGHHSLSAAQCADPEVLSLLALDPGLSHCPPGGALYFDTETTGLGGAGTLAYLVGLAWRDERDVWVLEQLFLKEPSCERALLMRVQQLVEQSSLLVSFNGRSFDWPLIKSRHVMNRLDAPSVRPHLDLLHLARRIHKRRLVRCRLIDLEVEILGFLRGENDISGADIAPLYGHFLRTGDEQELLSVVQHNAWDVMTMVALVGLYGQPFGKEHPGDLRSIGDTLLRAKSLEKAEQVAEYAIERGAIADGQLLRAKASKARGDIARALIDFEESSKKIDDPKLRLTLAKLYEHHARDFRRALLVVQQGTGEHQTDEERRRTRLEIKAQRSGQ